MQASIFKSNKSQAVRLPKQVAFPEEVKRVEVVVIGRTRVLMPADEVWDTWFAASPVPDDFMSERAQPAAQERDAL
ncbi:type II toxin-antitoxin system VapB family antitoxin [Paralysiella testudinis]|uniref:AbrB/MazE/SpoVT family DNA-binding domain-containing protein n=1 Tax=Paralysiella testudinis TaxID=2809020 RepID=A0A892ZJP9_9NEIS|nr:type II toxin-antitoxin system VapB family antitoxin [Paralysiella testudinis]QRQ82853.1 AbrB/MazE/SpoVT family DNA-binding domain-containing protein [Paralysiella testudinis]